MYKILLLLFLFVGAQAQDLKRLTGNLLELTRVDSVAPVIPADTSPPDTTGFAPSIVVGMPDTLTFSCTPSAVDSADWKDIVVSFTFEASYGGNKPTISTWTIPKTTALADSDSTVIFTLPVFYYHDADTSHILTTVVTLRDSLNNSISYTLYNTLSIYKVNPFINDTAWISLKTDSSYLFWTGTLNIRWDSTATVASQHNTWADASSYRFTTNSLINTGGTGNITSFYMDDADSTISSAGVDLLSSDYGKGVGLRSETRVYHKGVIIAGNSDGSDILMSDVYIIPDLWAGDISYVEATADTQLVTIDTLHGVFTSGDSLAVCGQTDTSAFLLDWIRTPTDNDTNFTFTWLVSANYDTTIYVFAKDTLGNLSSSYPIYVEIKSTVSEDVTPPGTPGSIVTTYESVYKVNINGTGVAGGDSIESYIIYVKANNNDSWTYLSTITAVDFPDTAISLSGVLSVHDSLFAKVAARDSLANIDLTGITDGYLIPTDDFYIAIDRDSTDQIKFIRDADSTLVGSDSTIILAGVAGSGAVIDTSNANNDSSLVFIAEAERGAYFTFNPRILGTYSNVYAPWKWWSPPDSIGSFVANQSVSGATDSMRFVMSGFPTAFDSIVFYHAQSAYALTNRMFAITDSVADTTFLFATGAGTYYVMTESYLNGTTGSQIGWAQVNHDTVVIPAGGGNGCATGTYTLFWDGDESASKTLACITSGSATEDTSATTSQGDSIYAATTGRSGNSFHFTDDGQYLKFAEAVNGTTGTAFVDIYTSDYTQQPGCIELYIDADNGIRCLIKSNARVYIIYEGGATVTDKDAGTMLVSNDTWTTIGWSWHADSLAVTNDGGSTWDSAAKANGTMSGNFSTITIGGENYGFAAAGFHEVKNVIVVSGTYKATKPTP